MKWKLTTLIENHADKEEKFMCEHGLSILIESVNQEQPFRLLMDTGQSGLFCENAVKMGISLKNLNALLISHAHYDHAGGVKKLIEEVAIKKMYVGKDFFHGKYYEKKDTQTIFPGVTLYRNFERTVKYELLNPHFFIKKEEGEYANICCVDKEISQITTDEIGDMYMNDYFTDEIAVALDTAKGLVVIVGCSHPGIMNILTTIERRSGKKICGVVGGTHLMEADEERLKKTITGLKERNINFIAVSHCTGEGNLEKIKEIFEEKFIFNCTGNVIMI